MYKIVRKKELNSAVTLMEIEAPFVAKKAKAGQFIIFRVDEQGERVPLTIAGYDREKGTVTIIFQKVGLSTQLLAAKEVGDTIRDFVGPLGVATEYEGFQKVAVVGGDKSVLIDAAADVTELFFDFVCRCHKFRLLFYTVLQKVVAFPVHSCYHLIKINQNKLYLAAILIISPL